MPSTYTGNPAAITPRQAVQVTNPVDGDALTAASNNTAIATLADILKYAMDKMGIIDQASTWTELQTLTKGIVLTQATASARAIEATGGASATAIKGTGGTGNTIGIEGQGVGTGPGLQGTGGPTNGPGVSGIGGTTNAIGVAGAGTGTAAGVRGTGGSTSGPGVTAFGGAPNGYGVDSTGDGTAPGVRGTGGDSNGIGVVGNGGATNGIGVYGVGAGSGVGVQGDGGSGPGVYGFNSSTGPGLKGHATGGGYGLEVWEGHARFYGTKPDKTDDHANTVTPNNIVKAWVHVVITTGNGTGNFTVDSAWDGFNVDSVVHQTAHNARITFGAQFDDTNYVVIGDIYDPLSVATALRYANKDVNYIDVGVRDGGGSIDLDAAATATYTFDLLFVGRN